MHVSEVCIYEGSTLNITYLMYIAIQWNIRLFGPPTIVFGFDFVSPSYVKGTTVMGLWLSCLRPTRKFQTPQDVNSTPRNLWPHASAREGPPPSTQTSLCHSNRCRNAKLPYHFNWSLSFGDAQSVYFALTHFECMGRSLRVPIAASYELKREETKAMDCLRGDCGKRWAPRKREWKGREVMELSLVYRSLQKVESPSEQHDVRAQCRRWVEVK